VTAPVLDPATDEPHRTARHRNEVLLVGTVVVPPAVRTLTDGAEIVTLRLEVAPDAQDGGGRDSFDCTIHQPRTRRAALSWQHGDTLEIVGAVRRRFYRTGAGSRPFTVVEVTRARRLPSGVRRPRRSG
jgi:single-strand DNA-binding protein